MTRILVGGEAEEHDRRVGGIHLAVEGILRQVRRQVGARRVDGGLNVTGRAVDVAAKIELHGDVGKTQLARRGHLGDAGDVANWRSKGVATEAAMICALAPGRPDMMPMVGKSTCGKGATGSTV